MPQQNFLLKVLCSQSFLYTILWGSLSLSVLGGGLGLGYCVHPHFSREIHEAQSAFNTHCAQLPTVDMLVASLRDPRAVKAVANGDML